MSNYNFRLLFTTHEKKSRTKLMFSSSFPREKVTRYFTAKQAYCRFSKRKTLQTEKKKVEKKGFKSASICIEKKINPENGTLLWSFFFFFPPPTFFFGIKHGTWISFNLIEILQNPKVKTDYLFYRDIWVIFASMEKEYVPALIYTNVFKGFEKPFANSCLSFLL